MDRAWVKKWLKFVVRWGIAAVGIWFVVSNISISDRVYFYNAATKQLVPRKLAGIVQGASQTVYSVYGDGGQKTTLAYDNIVAKADGGRIEITDPATHAEETVQVLGTSPVLKPGEKPLALYVKRALPFYLRLFETAPTFIIQQSDVKAPAGYAPPIPYPIVDPGLGPMVRDANLKMLLMALAVFPLTILICSYRWHELLKALSIHIGQGWAFKLNMVGMFYNTFMPGSTGGDVLKAYYASKVTPHRTRAVMSVLVDRVVGLLALVVLGGTMATYKGFTTPATDVVGHTCRRVSELSGLILFATAAGLTVFYNPTLRKLFLIDLILKKLPMQKQVNNALEVMEIYRQRPLLMLYVLVISVPVHMTVVLSALFCGLAFHLQIAPSYYFVCVPVIVLVGSIPISPQGAGVMEGMAYVLIRSQDPSVGHVVALTMSIRLVGIFWSLLGGIFVFKGDFHAPGAKEAEEAGGPMPIPPAITEV